KGLSNYSECFQINLKVLLVFIKPTWTLPDAYDKMQYDCHIKILTYILSLMIGIIKNAYSYG
ncbi:hypothetical protein, partial [Carboxylicivirga caseinilyticus]|uniref:hypothetical protein n=1 Tax=Carboxylicivirga caseinilyticus TaxID=3417572 RepID=UPI003D348459|nr:hypothetical protein [Marinilabiliaceae bacterium A049]